MTATCSRGGIRRLISTTTVRVITLVLLGLVSVPATALASEPSAKPMPGGLAASPARIEVGVQPSTSEVSVDVAVTNRGPQPTHVHTALSDLVVTQAGAYETAPAGQTPYSASSVAAIDRDDLNLDASGAPGATANIHVGGNVEHLDRPLYGAFTLEMEDLDPSTLNLDGIQVTPQLHPSILIPILFVPLGESDASADVSSSHLADSIRLRLQDVSLSVGQRDQTGWLDRAIPVSLPGVADHGPLLAIAGVQNTGNAFGRAFTKYAFAGVNPLGWLPDSWRAAVGLDEHPFLEVEAAPGALMPDMLGETRAATAYAPGRGAEVDSTPWFGLVRVRATTTLVLADFSSAPVVREAYVLVVPWKEALSAAAAWGVWRLWRTRRQRPLAKVIQVAVAAQPAEAA